MGFSSLGRDCAYSGFNTDWNDQFLCPRSGLALAAIRLPHEQTKSTARQLLANVSAAQHPRPWSLCDSKSRLVGGRTRPCSATCLFNPRWRLLIQTSKSPMERPSVAPGAKCPRHPADPKLSSLGWYQRRGLFHMKNPSPTIKRNPPKVTKPGFSVLIAAANEDISCERLATSAADRGKPFPSLGVAGDRAQRPLGRRESLHDRLRVELRASRS